MAKSVTRLQPKKGSGTKKSTSTRSATIKKLPVNRKKATATKKKSTASTARKTTARKAPAKKATAASTRKTGARKTTARKTVTANAKKSVSGIPSIVRQRYTKTEILLAISGEAEITKAQAQKALEGLEKLIAAHIRKRAAGEFVIPGLLKIKAAKKPATKKRMGRNPATGEEMVIPAKPACIKVRATPLKKLKEMAL